MADTKEKAEEPAALRDVPLAGYLRIRIIPLAHPVCTATAVRPLLALLSPSDYGLYPALQSAAFSLC